MSEVEKLEYLFSEYKYRHDLIWRVVFQFTFVVVLLSYLPYASHVEAIIRSKWAPLLISLPLLASGLALFGWKVLQAELEHFWRIVRAYHELQNQFLAVTVTEPEKSQFQPPADLKEDSFVRAVRYYVTVLVLLSIANVPLVSAWLSSQTP